MPVWVIEVKTNEAHLDRKKTIQSNERIKAFGTIHVVTMIVSISVSQATDNVLEHKT